MAKIHLEVAIPSNAKNYEVVLDDRMRVGAAKDALIEQISELEGYKIFASKDNICFCSVELNGLIEDGEIFREVGIKNGSRVVIV